MNKICTHWQKIREKNEKLRDDGMATKILGLNSRLPGSIFQEKSEQYQMLDKDESEFFP